ncbi:MAG: 5'/3'-nucleotidase SurE [Anaerolineae bacterium]|nr:5'/3'-nucleotidase SurE [Anaerolineae bacterium]
MTHLLLTNDDGIEAPGLQELLVALHPLARVSVFAPDHNWSAAGHTKTMHKPLRVTRYPLSLSAGVDPAGDDEVEAYTTTGAPSDCVALALLGILPEKPDLVVSGINQGANLGHDLTYSGTVAAAMEAVISGLPGIAVSLDSFESQDFAFAARVTARIVEQVLARGLPPGTMLNVNVPSCPADQVKGVAITRLGRRLYRDVLVERRDPRGRPYYWIGGEPPSGHPDEGTDIWAMASGFVSVTPLHLDMTAYELVPELEAWPLDDIV